jgi:hypothetical protein
MSASDYKTMTTAEIREDFLKFFEGKGCKLYPSSSLVPDDPSLLLANAGMNQFKEYYQGTKTMKEIGACSCQKCLRTNDIDNIGDARHLSFFEMLGNFSFGGYTKANAYRVGLRVHHLARVPRPPQGLPLHDRLQGRRGGHRALAQAGRPLRPHLAPGRGGQLLGRRPHRPLWSLLRDLL